MTIVFLLLGFYGGYFFVLCLLCGWVLGGLVVSCFVCFVMVFFFLSELA